MISDSARAEFIHSFQLTIVVCESVRERAGACGSVRERAGACGSVRECAGESADRQESEWE